MPRPKRARRAPPAPVAAAAPEEKSSPAPASGSDIYSHSDREHSVIRKELEKEDRGASSRLTRRASARVSRNASLRQKQALEESVHAVDEAMSRLEDELDTTSSKAKKDSEKRQKSEFSLELEFSRKTRATPVQNRRDTTGLDLDDEMFEGLDTTIGDDDDNDNAAAPPSAPRSDISTFSVSHFRRRGRAPSISINRDDAPIRPSSRGVGSTPGISSTFNIGLFKRRQREPSILGTAQKERAQRPIELSSGPDSDDEEGDDGFEPEAESTPFRNRRRTQPLAAEPESESQQILAPDSQPAQKDAAPSSSTASRKRKSTDSYAETDRPGKASRTEPEPELEPEPVPDLGDGDSDSELSDLPSPILTPTRPSAFPQPTTPNQDEIMAPPESSDSDGSEGIWPDIHTLAKQRRRRASPVTPTRDGNVSDASSPPSLTHSPNFPATRNKSRQKKQSGSPKVTTADLTGLLPRRRHKKARDPYNVDDTEEEEIDTSNLAEHDDELSYVDSRTRSRRAKAAPHDRGTANRPASRGAKAIASAEKPRAATRSSTRTYSRRLSDKENEAGGETAEGEAEAGAEGDSFAPVRDDVLESQDSSDPARSADELKKAARKFKEVDRWELEFEEVTEPSSPNGDAR
ncbi:hypothetical protein LY78DRAFT_652090 [Colletotrichum sublineola]|uniref:Uncharacterized protein n=1 Tax=Colletotrichum sublineola TaxID=1173701 RepID=A0A066XR92_COLSU|nr:hypothetical protein LY78DRAFT_652090 [Colletotrichum sublineola]KDN71733.1 hypothetical protein CSUB01_07785 [Colletotrichum sublineola]